VWVRQIGTKDKHLSRNHAWRHTFKARADRAGISERMSDYITGHAHRTVGAKYGAPTVEDMAEALTKFPKHEITIDVTLATFERDKFTVSIVVSELLRNRT
jgi:integrase